jgi:hypothetical protein
MNIVERSIAAERLVTELETAFTLAGRPAEGIADGQRTEVDFSRAATVLREQTGLVYIPPGRPWVNGHIESFNDRIRKAAPFPARGTLPRQTTSESDNHFSVTGGYPRHAENCRHSAHAREAISGSRATSNRPSG